MLTTYKEYISTKLLPNYFRENDSYKDQDGKGFLQRFLEVFGEELDNYSQSYIDELENLSNPFLLANVEFLNYKAFKKGDVDITSLNLDPATYRNFLTYILSIYKVKGTKKSYEAILALLGITQLSFQRYSVPEIKYDNPDILYDNEVNYDDSICVICFEYDLIVSGSQTLDSLFYSNLVKLVKLVEPINTKLKKVIYNGEELQEAPIAIYVDENGDLIYDNSNDPGLILELDENGDLLISGASANNYFVDNEGNLIYITP